MNDIKQGLSVSTGVAIARIHHLFDLPQVVIEKRGKGLAFEQERLKNALAEAVKELEALANHAKEKVGHDESNIFNAQALMLKDPMVLDVSFKKLEKHNYNAPYAFRTTMSEMIDLFEVSDNLYTKERVSDLKDITKRVLNILSEKKEDLKEINEDVILVAEELYPSITVQLDKTHIKGIITERGSKTSHSAILARQLGIPAITGVKVSEFIEGEIAIIDAKKGLVILNPSVSYIENYLSIVKNIEAQNELYMKTKDLPAKTMDGKEIKLNANIGSVDDLVHAHSFGADGIGLLRTENQYMESTNFPTEEELYTFYKEALEEFKDSKVVVRTLDIGGDKDVAYLNRKQEVNPFLGHRGIRYSLGYPSLFKTQLRALLRASNYGNLNVMFPMISTVDEVLEAKKIIKEAKESLHEEFVEVKSPKIGIMIEVPSAALFVDRFSKHIDFVSIGTNDLIQYLFAADRMNDKISYLYQPYHPVLLETIAKIVKDAHKNGIKVSVCGEMAGHPKQALLLLGLGVDELSMNAIQIPEIKYLISKTNALDLEKLARKAVKLDTNKEVQELIEKYIEKLAI
ncbi:phosphoenolpyruvate--protein phosphotransferase [Acholeplasma hippikon]|uniref:Phosphoenolpyruvate-protein phosphotransferase n=1 Tax=Acholeplasma hippikon TaxID=264636 RepID=A0A449BI42_9MOLU|nr:phosphoenolpyruvate--protein phosphotransferase [Acholeplasma hippikon]VEU82124.1 Phosphoenolpyruvate-protein phosphotransferase [Acholeplasma hippikon]